MAGWKFHIGQCVSTDGSSFFHGAWVQGCHGGQKELALSYELQRRVDIYLNKGSNLSHVVPILMIPIYKGTE